MDNNTELLKDLHELAKKHNISKGVLLCEKDNDDGSITNRVLLFKSRVVLQELTICDFANLISNCLTNSNTFTVLMNHFWGHSIHDAIKIQEIKDSQKVMD